MASTLIDNILLTDKYSTNDVFRQGGKIYTYLNPVSYLIALDNKTLFEQFDGIFVDGGLLAKAIRGLYSKRVTRRCFDMTSMAPELFTYAEEFGKTIYIIASKQEQLEKAAEIFNKRYPKINFVGFRNGYFVSEEEMDAEASHIAEVDPDFLIVGMGTPMQETFLLKVKEKGFHGIGFTCGGFIHQTAKSEKDYYPAWVDKTNLRFLYRIWKEPHTRKRYIISGLLFPSKFILEKISSSFH